MSSSEEDMWAPRCEGCDRLRWEFARYFPPHDGEDPFAAVHNVFGAGNVARLLAELAPEQRAHAVESLILEATVPKEDPDFVGVSPIAVLRNILEQAKGPGSAAHVEFEEAHVGHALPAFQQPFDAKDAPPPPFPLLPSPPRRASSTARAMPSEEGTSAAPFPAVEDVFGAGNVAKLLAELNTEQGAVAVELLAALAAARQHDPAIGGKSIVVILRDVLEQAKGPDPAALVAFEEEHVGHALPAVQQPFHPAAAQVGDEAQQADAEDEVAGDPETRRKRAAAAREACRQRLTLKRQKSATREPAPRWQVSGFQKYRRVAEQQRQAAMRQQDMMMWQHQQLQYAAVGHGASLGPHSLMTQQLFAAEAKITEKELRGKIIELAAAIAGVTTDQYMTTTSQQQQQDVACGQQQQQPSAAELARDQELMQQQQATAYAHAMDGSGSGAAAMPFQPGGLADAPPPILVQEQPQEPETADAYGSQLEASLPPLSPTLFDNFSLKQQNDGSDEGPVL